MGSSHTLLSTSEATPNQHYYGFHNTSITPTRPSTNGGSGYGDPLGKIVVVNLPWAAAGPDCAFPRMGLILYLR